MTNYTISSYISSLVDSYIKHQSPCGHTREGEYLISNGEKHRDSYLRGNDLNTKAQVSIFKHDIQTIICDALEVDKTYLYLNSDKQLTSDELEIIDSKILKYSEGEPLAYILGYKYFWDQKLFVTGDTLIPRADTEVLVERVLSDIRTIQNKVATELKQVQDDSESLKYKLKILDLGTGTGAIALALAGELPNSEIVAVDFSAKALDVAKKNAKENNITNVEFTQSDWYQNLQGQKFDIIVSNPPYIDIEDSDIDIEVAKYEPSMALFADNNGLADIEIIISQSKPFLRDGGQVYIEHGYSQAKLIQELFEEHGFVNVQTIKDLNGKDRCTVAIIQSIVSY